MTLDDRQKLDVLLTAYDVTHKEITRYRNLEWKITSWTVAVLGGIVAAVRTTPIAPRGQDAIKTLLIVFTFGAAVYGAWHLYFAHAKLVENWHVRRKLDNALKLFEIGVYIEGQSVFNSEWGLKPIRFATGCAHLLSWWGLIAVVMVYAIYVVLFG